MCYNVQGVGWKEGKIFLTGFLILVLSLLASCAPIKLSRPKDFSEFYDQPLSAEVSSWLKEGPQSLSSELIRQVSREITGKTRRERLYQVVDYFWVHLQYDEWYNYQSFKRTADEILKDRVVGGCSDFALVKAALFRAVGIPSRLVLTANLDWLKKFRNNPLAVTTGHVFIEVYLEDSWYLVDSPYRNLFSNYNPMNIYYPHDGLFCLRGIDYWSLELRSVLQLNEAFAQLTAGMILDHYQPPEYVVHEL